MIPQRWYWLGVISCCLLLATAYFYFQLRLGLVACPLCMFQRVALAAIAVLCLIGILLQAGKTLGKILAFLISLSALSGLAIAGRQTWLQHLPADQVPECGPDLAFMMEAFPIMEVITTVLSGSGECAEVQWRFIGFSMAEWMVFIFAVMLLVSVRLLFKKERRIFSGM